MKDIDSISDELCNSWYNGNKKFVVDRILKFKKAKAIFISLCVYEELDYQDKLSFAKLIFNRI